MNRNREVKIANDIIVSFPLGKLILALHQLAFVQCQVFSDLCGVLDKVRVKVSHPLGEY